MIDVLVAEKNVGRGGTCVEVVRSFPRNIDNSIFAKIEEKWRMLSIKKEISIQNRTDLRGKIDTDPTILNMLDFSKETAIAKKKKKRILP